jgi:hypothetical protein
MLTPSSFVRLLPVPCFAAMAELACSLHLRTLLPLSIWLSYGWAGLLLPLLLRCRALPLLRAASEQPPNAHNGSIAEGESPCIPIECEAR